MKIIRRRILHILKQKSKDQTIARITLHRKLIRDNMNLIQKDK